MFQTLLQQEQHSDSFQISNNLYRQVYRHIHNLPRAAQYRRQQTTYGVDIDFYHDQELNQLRECIDNIRCRSDILFTIAEMHQLNILTVFKLEVDNMYSATRHIIHKVKEQEQCEKVNDRVIDAMHEWGPTLHMFPLDTHEVVQSSGFISRKIRELAIQSRYHNDKDTIYTVSGQSFQPKGKHNKLFLLNEYYGLLYDMRLVKRSEQKYDNNGDDDDEKEVSNVIPIGYVTVGSSYYFEELYQLLYVQHNATLNDWKMYLHRVLDKYERGLLRPCEMTYTLNNNLWFVTNEVCWQYIQERKQMSTEVERALGIFDQCFNHYIECVRVSSLHQVTKRHLIYFLKNLTIVNQCASPLWFEHYIPTLLTKQIQVQEDCVLYGRKLSFQYTLHNLFAHPLCVTRDTEQASFGLHMSTLSQPISYNKFQHKIFVSPTAIVVYMATHNSSLELLNARYCVLLNNMISYILFSRKVYEVKVNGRLFHLFSNQELKVLQDWKSLVKQTQPHYDVDRLTLVVAKMYSLVMSCQVCQRCNAPTKQTLYEYLNFVMWGTGELEQVAQRQLHKILKAQERPTLLFSTLD